MAEPRDSGITVMVPRTLLRRIAADLEFLTGFVDGQVAQVDDKGECPPEIQIARLRVQDARNHLGGLVHVANIDEDEDLDD